MIFQIIHFQTVYILKENQINVKDFIEQLKNLNQEAEIESVISTFDGNTEAENFYINPYDEKTKKVCKDIDATNIEFGLELNHKFEIKKARRNK